jgi:hypothetical protein
MFTAVVETKKTITYSLKKKDISFKKRTTDGDKLKVDYPVYSAL